MHPLAHHTGEETLAALLLLGGCMVVRARGLQPDLAGLRPRQVGQEAGHHRPRLRTQARRLGAASA